MLQPASDVRLRLRHVDRDSKSGRHMHVDDEEKIMLGSIPIQFHAAPGHTNDSMIVHVPGYMMTGDFLFNGKGGVGRDDLPSGRVHVHWDALEVLARFEGSTVVCSGHDRPEPK